MWYFHIIDLFLTDPIEYQWESSTPVAVDSKQMFRCSAKMLSCLLNSIYRPLQLLTSTSPAIIQGSTYKVLFICSYNITQKSISIETTLNTNCSIGRYLYIKTNISHETVEFQSQSQQSPTAKI